MHLSRIDQDESIWRGQVLLARMVEGLQAAFYYRHYVVIMRMARKAVASMARLQQINIQRFVVPESGPLLLVLSRSHTFIVAIPIRLVYQKIALAL